MIVYTDDSRSGKLSMFAETKVKKNREMKTISMIMSAALMCCIAPCFADEGWFTNMEDARKAAKAEKKGILIEFTGSDWCPPCIELKKKVMSNPKFLELARKHFVLLELDYPRSKPQDPTLKENNAKLAKEYAVRGFPTVVFADAEGVAFGGFVGGHGLESVIENLTKALERNKTIATIFEKIKKSSNDEHIALLVELHKLYDGEILAELRSSVEEMLIEIDKDDKSGLVKKIKIGIEVKKAEKEAIAIYGDIRSNATNLGGPAGMLAAILPHFDKPEISVLTKQMLVSRAVNLYFATDNYDGAVTLLKKALEWDPESYVAPELKATLEDVTMNKDLILQRMQEMKAKQEQQKK